MTKSKSYNVNHQYVFVYMSLFNWCGKAGEQQGCMEGGETLSMSHIYFPAKFYELTSTHTKRPHINLIFK